MSNINVLTISMPTNPAPFGEPFRFEITFECLGELAEDLEWKLVYVGSANSNEFDQELQDVLVGPVPVGLNRFILEADAPDLSRIPPEDRVGVTALLLTCLYRDREFIRVGYYVNNELVEPVPEGVEAPAPEHAHQLTRNVLTDQPRLTRFHIDWS